MKTIYLVELRQKEGEWTPMAAYTTKELAENAIVRNIRQDEELELNEKFFYRVNEIGLFDF